MDLEVLLRLLLHSAYLHGYSNTLPGATVVLLVTVPLGRSLCWWNRNLSLWLARWLAVDAEVSWAAAWLGGAVGVYSHWLFDAMMHSDVRPLAPFSPGNPLLGC